MTRTPIRLRAPAGLMFALATLTASTIATGVTGPALQPAYAFPPRGPLPAVHGLTYVTSFSALNSTSAKTVFAECPTGKQVLGGEASIDAPLLPGQSAGGTSIILTQMEPYRAANGRYRWSVTAVETYAGTTYDWHVGAVATCVDPVPGYQIKNGTSTTSSSSLQETAAVCPVNQRVLGEGARINPYFTWDAHGAQVVYHQGLGLQVMRASGTGDISRAQAHEAPEGYPYPWSVTAFAVCADPLPGYEVIYSDELSQHGNEPFKQAQAECPTYRYYEGGPGGLFFDKRKQLLGMGATVADGPGNVALHGIYLWFESWRMRSDAIATTYTPLNWSISSQIICVY